MFYRPEPHEFNLYRLDLSGKQKNDAPAIIQSNHETNGPFCLNFNI